MVTPVLDSIAAAVMIYNGHYVISAVLITRAWLLVRDGFMD